MTSLPIRLFTVILAICIFQVYVLGGGLRSNVATDKTIVNSSADSPILGRLAIGDDQSIVVNGNSANSGTTIFSGARVQTPDDVDAVVQLGASSVSIVPNSDVTVVFDHARVDVRVMAGKAFVKAPAEVKYSVTTPYGKPLPSEADSSPLPSPNKMSGKKKAAIIIPIVFAAIFIPLCIAKCGGNESSTR